MRHFPASSSVVSHMLRPLWVMLALSAFLLLGGACRTAARPAPSAATDSPSNTASTQTAAPAQAHDPADDGHKDARGPLDAPDVPTGQVAQDQQGCPAPLPYEGMCAQVMTWAKNPQSGQCCEYATPCETPTGWVTYRSLEACAQAPGSSGSGAP